MLHFGFGGRQAVGGGGGRRRGARKARRVRTALTAFAAGALTIALAPGQAAAGHGDGNTAGTGPNEHANVHATVEHMLHGMTLRQKVGQLFITHAYGASATTQADWAVAHNQKAYGVDNAAQLIDKYHLGGIIYYTWTHSLQNPTQIAELSNGIQRAAMDQRTPIPALVATDQEQGVVTRIGPPATQFPGNMALGATRSTDDAYTAARITGRELKAMGINQDFAPVADVNVNPRNPVIGVRSFGSNPDMVADMTAAAARGYQDTGITASAKHFPGHGDTNVDSHSGLPVIHHTREEWRNIDLPPFRAAIDNDIGAIMTAHIVVPSLDPSGDPATLSKPIITGILRHKLNYDGVVVTDSLGMAAVREKYGDKRVPVLAIKAGVDMLLKPPEGKLDEQYNAVIDAVRSREIPRHRLNQAVQHILTLKFELGLFDDPYVDVSKVDERVGAEQSDATAQKITDRTTTLVKNEGGLLPLSPNSGKDVLVTGWGSATTASLADKISGRGVNVDRMYTGSPSGQEIDEAVAAAENHDITVVTAGAAWDDNAQRKLVRQLVDTGKPVIAVAVEEPYDVAYFPDVPAYLATYSYSDVSLESAARVLFGEVSPSGKLPVMIPTAGDPEEVLYPYGYGKSY